MGSIETDQRRFTRYPVRLKAVLRFHDRDVPTRLETVDLGLEGVQCLTLEPIPDGGQVLVKLQVEPDGPWLECKGKICWATVEGDARTRFGVRFVDLLEDERERLGKAVSTFYVGEKSLSADGADGRR